MVEMPNNVKIKMFRGRSCSPSTSVLVRSTFSNLDFVRSRFQFLLVSPDLENAKKGTRLRIAPEREPRGLRETNSRTNLGDL